MVRISALVAVLNVASVAVVCKLAMLAIAYDVDMYGLHPAAAIGCAVMLAVANTLLVVADVNRE